MSFLKIVVRRDLQGRSVIDFDGQSYFDDRMFLLHVAKCTVSEIEDGVLETKIFHETPPEIHSWCVVTYRNTPGHPGVRVDHFEAEDHARAYVEKIEPLVPRVSLGGGSPREPLSYENFVAWKAKNGLKEYDYRTVYTPGGTNHRELVLSRKTAPVHRE